MDAVAVISLTPTFPPPPQPRRCLNTIDRVRLRRRGDFYISVSYAAHRPILKVESSYPPPSRSRVPEVLVRYSCILLHFASISVVAVLVALRANACQHSPSKLPPAACISSVDPGARYSTMDVEGEEVDTEMISAFQNFKSKTFALTVPLKIVALRGSLPPSWIKDFIQVQGRRLKLGVEFRGTLDSIFSELAAASKKDSIDPKSIMAADIISAGDSWLSLLINKGFVEPVHVGEKDWFKGLSNKWKVFLCRNTKGVLDSDGFVWGVPYRWGSVVIAYKKTKFKSHNLKPINDWSDLWRPELKGKISMVDSPREVIGAVLKHIGASYNTEDLDSQVVGGKQAVLHHLKALQKQVRLFDSQYYLKAFESGEVWVAVGWSSDVIPASKRMSDIVVIVPKSGASLWADLWVVPSVSKFGADRIGGRVRSPSPLVDQWIEFCLQPARSLPFQQEIIPGASPIDLRYQAPEREEYIVGEISGKPKLETNLECGGIPPAEILERCEFLEPLKEQALEDHRWLISKMQEEQSWVENIAKQLGIYRNPIQRTTDVRKRC